MTLALLLTTAARAFPASPAVSLGTRTVYDYATLQRRAAILASALRSTLDCASGDRVALWMGNSPAYIEIMWGCWIAGLCVVPINAKLHAREVGYILKNSGARILFVDSDGGDDIEDAVGWPETLKRIVGIHQTDYQRLFEDDPIDPIDVASDSAAWLFYTSGTTGRPKGATLTHRGLTAMAISYLADIDALDERDSILHAAPISHASGLISLSFVAKGGNQICVESGGFSPVEIIDLFRRCDRVTLFAAPTMLKRLVEEPTVTDSPLPGLKTIIYGGAPMYLADLKRALERLGPRLIQVYGQGETPNTATFLSKRAHADVGHPEYERRLSATGLPRTGVEVRIVDDQGNELPRGQLGEVTTRSEITMSGYWNDPESTGKALRNGWLFTGDVGVMDEFGYLTLKDRSKDLIISGGSNIYPREIEEILLLHPGVREASVIGRPHPEWGEEVIAFVAVREGAAVEAADLDALCLDHVARFKRPRSYIFIDHLPKNNYGKVLKTELRRRVANN